MPKKDGTGPNGNGPMTGYGSGNCVIPLNTKKEELTYLENQARVLREELKTLQNRISTVKNPDNKE